MHVQKCHSKVRYIKHINVPVDKACMGISSACILSKYHQMTRLVCLYDKQEPDKIVRNRIIWLGKRFTYICQQKTLYNMGIHYHKNAWNIKCYRIVLLKPYARYLLQTRYIVSTLWDKGISLFSWYSLWE